ncbi:MAG: GNAT family N-acetyltransferase [Dehalococcoidia bacterium]|nr:GNAT family N-acetyltransferase [Dehalococcoidia bacterium]
MVTQPAAYPSRIRGAGLELRPWDADLVRQMATWGERGFPYHAFDLGYLKDPRRASAGLARTREDGPHRHFVACEEGVAVGRVSVNLRDEAGLYLWSVHVPPEHEGRGVCRRMLATLMTWLEEQYPRSDFVLTTNTFATHAHRAYRALGFATSETRWHFDRDIAEELWRAPSAAREEIAPHVRFHNGRWEVRVFIMRRRRGTPMSVGPAAEVRLSQGDQDDGRDAGGA